MTWIAGEAVRNIGAGTTKALRYACALAVILCVCALADVLSVNALILRAQEYRDSGASITTLEAPGLIDGATCDSFAALHGVRAAGAIQQNDPSLTPAALPNGSIASFRVTAGAVRLFHADDDTGAAGVLVSKDVLDTLGIGAGAILNTAHAQAPVRGSFDWPQDGRRPGYSYAALAPDASEDAFDECWVDAWPAPPNLGEIMRTALNPDPTGQTKVIASQVNTTKGRTFDGGRSYAERVTRYAPYAAMLAGFIIGYAAIRSRRLELAAAQHVGVTRTQQMLQTSLETCAWVLAAGLMAAAVVAASIVSVATSDRLALAHIATYVALPGLVSTLLGSVAASASIRESHLFIYFKTR